MCVLDVTHSSFAANVGECRGHDWALPDGFSQISQGYQRIRISMIMLDTCRWFYVYDFSQEFLNALGERKKRDVDGLV